MGVSISSLTIIIDKSSEDCFLSIAELYDSRLPDKLATFQGSYCFNQSDTVNDAYQNSHKSNSSKNHEYSEVVSVVFVIWRAKMLSILLD